MGRPPSICLMGALFWETWPAVRRLHLVCLPGHGAIKAYCGIPFGQRVYLIRSGPGAGLALQGARWLLERCQPVAFISVGFAGGLVPGLKLGDLVIADLVKGAGIEFPEGVYSSPPIVKMAQAAAEGMGLNFTVGPLVTLEQFVASREERRVIGRSSKALAVDMESGYVARAAQDAGAPFLAVRFISDPLDVELPPSWVRGSRHPPGGGLLYSLRFPLLFPARLPLMAKLLKAARDQGRFLEQLIFQISRELHAEGDFPPG